MKRTHLAQLFTLAAISLFMVAAAVLQPPGFGTLRKAYLLNLRSIERITDPFNQWSNAYAFSLIAGDGTPVKLGLGLMLAGGVLLGLALYFSVTAASSKVESGRGSEVNSAQPSNQSKSRIRWLPLGIGVLLLWLLAEMNGNLLGLEFLQGQSVHLQFVLLVLALIFVTLSFIPLKWRIHFNREWLIVGGITLIALLIRLWKLETLIHGLIDEMHFINAVTQLWAKPNDIRLLQPFSTVPAFPWVFPYLQWGTVELGGNNLAAIRLISVLMGTLTIPLLYLLARSQFDKTTATLAALLLATFPPHIHFSRAGINNIADPLFGTATFAFLAYGFSTRRQWPFALAGISLSLTQYFYDGGRLLYPALVLAWLILSGLLHLTAKSSTPRINSQARVAKSVETDSLNEASENVVPNPPSRSTPLTTNLRQQSRRHLLIFLLTALLIAAPIYYTRIGLDETFSPRGQDVSANKDFWRTVLVGDNGELIYLRHLAYTFFIYVYMPEMSWFYGGHTPLILHALVPLFLFGLFYSLWKFRHPGPLLLMLWLLLVALGNTLLRESATAARYVVVFPALALLMAVGLRQAVALVLADFWPKKAQAVLLGLLVTLMAAGQTYYYFDRHIEGWNDGRLALDADDAMFRAAEELPTGTHVHLVNEIEIVSFNLNTMRVFLHRTDLQAIAIYPEQFTAEYLANLPRDVPHAFFLPPDNYEMLVLLVRHFEIEPPAYSPYDLPRQWQFVLYFAPLELNQSSPSAEQWLKQ